MHTFIDNINTEQPDDYIIETINGEDLSVNLVDSYYDTSLVEESLTYKKPPEPLSPAPRTKVAKTSDNQSIGRGTGTSYPVTVGQDVTYKKQGTFTTKVYEGLNRLTSKRLNVIEDKEKQIDNLNQLSLKKSQLQLKITEMEYKIMELKQETEKEKCASELKQVKLKEQILESELNKTY